MSNLLEILTKYDNIFAIGTTVYTSFSLILLLINKIRSWYRIKAVKTLLGSKQVYIHILTRDNRVGNEQRIKPTVAMEDYSSAEYLRSVLQKYGVDFSIRYIQLDGVIEFAEDKVNIVICGPKNSFVIEKYFDDLRDRYSVYFNKDGDEWYLENCGSKYYSPINARDSQYAFIGKTEEFLLICGIHAIGSEGVIHYIRKSKI